MMAPRQLTTRQRQVVRALFIPQPEIGASTPPLRAMRRNPPAARALMSEKVREFVAQSTLDFLLPKRPQPRIEPHQGTPWKCQAGRGPQPRIPLDAHPLGQRRGSHAAKQHARIREQRLHWLGIGLHHERRRRCLAEMRAISPPEKPL